MGVGVYLQGHGAEVARDADTWFERLVSWLDEHAGEPLLDPARLVRDGQGNPIVTVALHPCAEDMEIRLAGPGRLVARGKTSGAGPGYHIYLCDLLDRIGGELNVHWLPPDDGSGEDDAGGFFRNRDVAALEDEFLMWLRQVARVVLERLTQDYSSLMISMPLGHSYPRVTSLVTPMGPRDREWLAAVADGPRRGIDIFPWWSAGTGATFSLGRALARMWRDLRWRVPLDEDEGRLLMEVHLDLARAHALDPSLDYPWREWAELMDYVQDYFGYLEMHGQDVEDEVRRRAAAMPEAGSPPLVGYRRSPVRAILTDGWSIEIPGAMAESWDDDGLWSAWDAERAVHFKSFGLTRADGEKPSAAEIVEGLSIPDGEPVGPVSASLPGRAVLYESEEDGESFWRITGHAAVDGGLCICHILFRQPEDRDWAIATWRSIAIEGS